MNPRDDTSRAPISRPAIAFPAVMIAVYVLGVLPSLGQSLLETHAHRQTQTALTAVLYARDGIDLLRPPLPILGPPGAIPQELPLFQAAGALLIDLGIGPDLAMRVVGLACFVASAVALYILARRLVSGPAALVTLAAYLFNAHAWLYGRTSLIEYLATGSSVAFVYYAIRGLDDGRPRHWIAATLFGVVGMVVKITTAGFYLLPVLLWRARDGRWGFRHAWAWVAISISLIFGIAWSEYAQVVREETPAAIFLSMENQLSWFLGTAGERFDLGSWRVPIVGLIGLTGFGLVVWAALAVARARHLPQAPFLLTLMAIVPGAPLVLFNLYAIHDYYLAAIAPIIALGIGLAVDWLREHWRRRWVRRLGVGLVGAWVATIIGTFSSWSIIYGTPAEEARAMSIATFIRDHSDPDDWVVLRGWGWNSAFFYYAGRRGLAVPEPDPALAGGQFGEQDISDIDFDALFADPVFGPFITCDHIPRCEVVSPP